MHRNISLITEQKASSLEAVPHRLKEQPRKAWRSAPSPVSPSSGCVPRDILSLRRAHRTGCVRVKGSALGPTCKVPCCSAVCPLYTDPPSFPTHLCTHSRRHHVAKAFKKCSGMIPSYDPVCLKRVSRLRPVPGEP